MSDYMQGDYDKAVQVPFSDDETEKKPDGVAELDDEPRPDESPEERRTRKQKRNERMHRLLENGRQAEEKLKLLEEREQQREREIAELRGMVTATQQIAQQRQQEASKDPYEAELDAIYKRQAEAYAAAQAEIKAGTFNEARERHYSGIAREVETSKARVLLRRELAQQEPQRRAEQGQQQWVNKYPEVYSNPQAYAYAEGTFNRRRALGETPSPALVDEVMQEAMTQFRLGKKAAPSETERSRMMGIASSGGQGGGNSGPTGITITPEIRRIAAAAYPDKPEPEAIKAWVNKTGKRMRERKQL